MTHDSTWIIMNPQPYDPPSLLSLFSFRMCRDEPSLRSPEGRPSQGSDAMGFGAVNGKTARLERTSKIGSNPIAVQSSKTYPSPKLVQKSAFQHQESGDNMGSEIMTVSTLFWSWPVFSTFIFWAQNRRVFKASPPCRAMDLDLTTCLCEAGRSWSNFCSTERRIRWFPTWLKNGLLGDTHRRSQLQFTASVWPKLGDYFYLVVNQMVESLAFFDGFANMLYFPSEIWDEFDKHIFQLGLNKPNQSAFWLNHPLQPSWCPVDAQLMQRNRCCGRNWPASGLKAGEVSVGLWRVCWLWKRSVNS